MSTAKQPYTLSIEPVRGKSFRYGFHLGTDLAQAKKLAEEKFHARNLSPLKDVDGVSMATRTVALFQGRDMIDVYDGTWSSDHDWTDCPEVDEQTAKEVRAS